MKAIETQLHITSISSRADNSLRLSCVTPELSNPEKVAFMELQNINLQVFFNPLDVKVEDEVKVDRLAGEKSPSERQRAVLFRLWEQGGKKNDFDSFYKAKMEVIIDMLKDKLL